MREGNYKLSANGVCPDGFKPNMLRCVTSRKWCEPTSRVTTTSDQFYNWKNYENQTYGFSLKYPDSFSLNNMVLAKGGPISFDTFEHKYANGGIIPRGEMEFSIFPQPAPADLNSFIDNELGDVQTTDITIEGKGGKLVKFEGGDGPDLPGSELAAYVVNGDWLWKIQLRVADFSFEPQTLTTFNQILSTLKFTNETKFIGVIQEISNQSIVDGALRVKINGVWVTIHGGEMAKPNSGTLIGFDLNRDLQPYVGKKAEVYARKTGYDQSLTILGNSKYYLKIID